MQDLNNDIEDIFRRAADAYPLKDGEDRWDEISGRLDNNSGSEPGKNMIWKQAIIVLVLIVAFLAVNDGRIKQRFIALSPGSETKPFTHTNEIAGDNANLNVDEERAQPNNRSVLPVLMTNHFYDKIPLVNNVPADQENNVSVVQHQAEKISPDKKLTVTAEENLSSPEKLPGNQQSISVTGESTTVLKENDAMESKMQKPARQQKNNGIFYGISAGINASEVKLDGFSKPSVQAGAIVGYQFNKHGAVETGLLISTRNYKSEGKYFNTKNMQSSMPVGMDIKSLTGKSTFLEIPVQVSYHVALSNRKSVYIKSGVSSYIVNSENNHYKTMLNGTEGSMDGSYKENKFYPAAALTVAVGLQKEISISMGIRVEPFVQLPLKGMGVGELPFKNAGLRLILFH